jgi:hypothetical protein
MWAKTIFSRKKEQKGIPTLLFSFRISLFPFIANFMIIVCICKVLLYLHTFYFFLFLFMKVKLSMKVLLYQIMNTWRFRVITLLFFFFPRAFLYNRRNWKPIIIRTNSTNFPTSPKGNFFFILHIILDCVWLWKCVEYTRRYLH